MEEVIQEKDPYKNKMFVLIDADKNMCKYCNATFVVYQLCPGERKGVDYGVSMNTIQPFGFCPYCGAQQ